MGMGQGLAQTLIQTYTDRCTGVTQVFTVPMNGQTVVSFYNRSKTFTSQDFQNGTLQAWLEETYLWWTSLAPVQQQQQEQQLHSKQLNKPRSRLLKQPLMLPLIRRRMYHLPLLVLPQLHKHLKLLLQILLQRLLILVLTIQLHLEQMQVVKEMMRKYRRIYNRRDNNATRYNFN